MCVRACVRECVRACVRVFGNGWSGSGYLQSHDRLICTSLALGTDPRVPSVAAGGGN